jgi:hypothetical protein
MEIKISKLDDLFSFLENVRNRYYFRGYSVYEKHMLPGLGRNDHALIQDEVKTLQEFVEIPGIKCLKISKLHDLLELGQHYQLPTRLLDWTTDPYVALYFALGEEQYFDDKNIMLALISISNTEIKDEWSQIDDLAIHNTLADLDTLSLSALDPLTLREVDSINFKSNVLHPLFANKYSNFIESMSDKVLIRYQVNDFVVRMKKQSGLFTIHKKVDSPIDRTLCDMIVEAKLSKDEMHEASKMLRNLAKPICKETVYPDPEYGTCLYEIQKWCEVKRGA